MAYNILVADDCPLTRRLVEKHLRTAGHTVHTAGDGLEGLHLLHWENPQIVITDWEMPRMSGADFVQALRASEALGFVYVIVLTAHADMIMEAIEAGADDFLAKPLQRNELLARVKAGGRVVELEADLARRARELSRVNAEFVILNRKLTHMAAVDELTGLCNRRKAYEELHRLWAQAQAGREPLTCISIDIDHFKKINDTFGHEAGDEALRVFADLLRRHAAHVLPCRFGGEEFLVLCPGMNAAGAGALAEAIRLAASTTPAHSRCNEIRFTVSLGLAEKDQECAAPADLLRAADRALYQAKRQGRNRLCTVGQVDSPALAAADRP